MKKYFHIIALMAIIFSATACLEWRVDSKFDARIINVTAETVSGHSFAQNPYGGTAWGDSLAECVTFYDNGQVGFKVVNSNDIGSCWYGYWVADGTDRIIITKLQVGDYMSGRRYNICEARVGIMRNGSLALFLGYSNGTKDATYDDIFVYEEDKNYVPALDRWYPYPYPFADVAPWIDSDEATEL